MRTRIIEALTARRLAIISVTLLAIPALSPAPVNAAGRPGQVATTRDPQLIENQNPAVLAEMRQQERLHPAVRKLDDAAYSLPATSGFAGVAFEGTGIALYYKGALPAAMASAVADARRIGTVTVKPALYSRHELEIAQAEIEKLVERSHAEVAAIGVPAEGSGIVIEKMSEPTARHMRDALSRKKGIATTSASDFLAGLRSSVPITVRDGQGGNQLLSSREDDFSPWNGGGEYEVFRGGDLRNPWCTGAFGVVVGSQTYVLTAGHCLSDPDVAYNGHIGECCFEQMGPVYSEDWDHDILLINTRGSVLMFDGGVNSSVTKTVHSWGDIHPNELLCTSGSKSGVICNERTDGGQYTYNGCDSDGDCFNMHSLAKAINLDGTCVGIGGDSGGPVFSLDGNGVQAKGVISGKNPNNCAELHFQDMDQIAHAHGWIPNTA